MTKTEIVCESCNEHYILVTIEEKNSLYCPFCSSPFAEEALELGDEE